MIQVLLEDIAEQTMVQVFSKICLFLESKIDSLKILYYLLGKIAPNEKPSNELNVM